MPSLSQKPILVHVSLLFARDQNASAARRESPAPHAPAPAWTSSCSPRPWRTAARVGTGSRTARCSWPSRRTWPRRWPCRPPSTKGRAPLQPTTDTWHVSNTPTSTDVLGTILRMSLQPRGDTWYVSNTRANTDVCVGRYYE